MATCIVWIYIMHTAISFVAGQTSSSPSTLDSTQATSLTMPTPTQTAASVNCTFDNSLCGYTNGSAGSLRWAWSVGKYIRGISKDHTSGQGGFMYLTTNTIGSASNAKSSVLSPPLTLEGWVCVSFYYWIPAQTYYNIIWVWLVAADARNDANTVHSEILTVWGKGLTWWVRANVTAYVMTNDSIAFVSSKTGFFDYVAIDDVSVTQGNCSYGNPTSKPDDLTAPTTLADTGQKTFRPTRRTDNQNGKSQQNPSTSATCQPISSRQKATSKARNGQVPSSQNDSPSSSTSSSSSSLLLSIPEIITIVLVIFFGILSTSVTVVAYRCLLRRNVPRFSPTQSEIITIEETQQ